MSEPKLKPCITLDDIYFSGCGFDCKKIKHLSNKQLERLEDNLSEMGLSTQWANTEEMDYLAVAWQHFQILKKNKEEDVCQLLNTFIRQRRADTTKREEGR